jgi:hypothetical protein
MKTKEKIKNIRENLISIGNKSKDTYDQTNDLKAAIVAIKAYSEVTKTTIAQIRYKDKTGLPSNIDFLEE